MFANIHVGTYLKSTHFTFKAFYHSRYSTFYSAQTIGIDKLGLQQNGKGKKTSGNIVLLFCTDDGGAASPPVRGRSTIQYQAYQFCMSLANFQSKFCIEGVGEAITFLVIGKLLRGDTWSYFVGDVRSSSVAEFKGKLLVKGNMILSN